MKTAGSGTQLDTDEPVEIKLPDGGSLRVRGRIDRIDQVAGPEPNVFAIWDYKTGGTWKYTQEPRPFWAGRVVQHALYTLVMNARLKAVSAASSRRARSSGSATSSRARRPAANGSSSRRKSSKGQDVLGAAGHDRLRAARSWRPIKHDKDCGFCDYRGHLRRCRRRGGREPIAS